MMVRTKRLAVVLAWLAWPGWLAWLALSGLLAHCGDSSDSPEDDGVALPDRVDPEAGEPADAIADAAAFACDPARPFGAPTLIPGLDTSAFYATPRLAPDELSLYFTTVVLLDGAQQADLVRAVRTSRSAPFGPAAALTALDTPQSDNDPMIASDLRSLWFSSTRSGKSELYVARRSSPSDELGMPSLVPGLSGPWPNAHAYYRLAGPELWFTSDRTDSGGYDIYLAPLQDGSFGAATLVSELSSPGFEAHPQISEDGLRILLASNRPGGAGGFDLWVASRRSTAEKFGAPAPLAVVNTAADEYGGWISPDGCRLYFSSNRDTDAAPRHRLWYAERAK